MRCGREDTTTYLLSQLLVGFKFDQLHQIFNHQITLEFFLFLFSKRAITISVDEFICAFSHLGRGMESHNLFGSWMIRQKLCDFSSSPCFEKHCHFLLLQKKMSHSPGETDKTCFSTPAEVYSKWRGARVSRT